MQKRIPQRIVQFSVTDGCLIRTVTGSDGRGYSQRCELSVFQTIAHIIDELPPQGEGISTALIWKREGLAFTQVNIALEFLKERGIVAVRGRRCHPGTRCVYEDAMVEFHALAHSGQSV